MEIAGVIFVVLYLALIVLMIVGQWKMFVKAGQPGWASIVPIYNFIVFLAIVGKPWWWLFLCIVPFVNIVIWIILCIDLAKCFGKGTGFAVGIILLGFIFIPILGLGDAKYQGAGQIA